MNPQPRLLFPVALVMAVCCLALLPGCQSDQEERLAETRRALSERQPPPAAAPAGQSVAAPVAAPHVPDIGMPIYPGARPVGGNAGLQEGLNAGLAMSLMETRDSVDAVIAFYKDRLSKPGSRLEPTKTEDRLDGRRVVRLSVPQEDGGLQTVEARDDVGKTTIQLMNMAGQAHGAVPSTIPGVTGSGGSRDSRTHGLPPLGAGTVLPHAKPRP
jgi:hypothetical protein